MYRHITKLSGTLLLGHNRGNIWNTNWPTSCIHYELLIRYNDRIFPNRYAVYVADVRDVRDA